MRRPLTSKERPTRWTSTQRTRKTHLMATLQVYPARTGIAPALAEIGIRLHALWSQREDSHPRSPTEMLDAEEARRRLGGEIADLLSAADVLRAHQDEKLVEEAVAEARRALKEKTGFKRIKNTGWRPTSVRFPHGLVLKLPTPCLRPDLRGRRGRRRGSGKRRNGGAGAYPVLERLGISDLVTPLTRSDIGRQAVLSGSFAEAQEQLRRQGLDVDIDTLVRVAVGAGVRALLLRDDALECAQAFPLPDGSPFAGKRIRVSVDGGRARVRTAKPRSRKGKNGRRPFDLDWREPRIVTIDVIDAEGEADRSWRPIYEVSMGNADEVFALLTGLLRLIGAHLAAEVVFVSDGALWIWDRLEQLVQDAEIPPERFRAVLDFYHASEHIADALKACKNIGAKARASMLKKLCRKLLEQDGAQKVIDELAPLAKGRRAAKVKKEIAYLKGHLDHMRYAELREAKVPIGSGVVESAVRRIINLRFKSASLCWRLDHLEPLMYLRAIIKAGHWDDAMRAWLQGRHWLNPEEAALSTISSLERKTA